MDLLEEPTVKTMGNRSSHFRRISGNRASVQEETETKTEASRNDNNNWTTWDDDVMVVNEGANGDGAAPIDAHAKRIASDAPVNEQQPPNGATTRSDETKTTAAPRSDEDAAPVASIKETNSGSIRPSPTNEQTPFSGNNNDEGTDVVALITSMRNELAKLQKDQDEQKKTADCKATINDLTKVLKTQQEQQEKKIKEATDDADSIRAALAAAQKDIENRQQAVEALKVQLRNEIKEKEEEQMQLRRQHLASRQRDQQIQQLKQQQQQRENEHRQQIQTITQIQQQQEEIRLNMQQQQQQQLLELQQQQQQQDTTNKKNTPTRARNDPAFQPGTPGQFSGAIDAAYPPLPNPRTTIASTEEFMRRKMAIDNMVSRRPKQPYDLGNPLQVKSMFVNFQTNTSDAYLSSADRLQELRHYVSGSALKIVDAQLQNSDQSAGLARAMEQIEKLFGSSYDTAFHILKDLKKGGPIGEYEDKKLVDFFAELELAYALAKNAGVEDDFGRPDNIISLINSKVQFMRNPYANLMQRAKREQRKVTFEDFQDLIFDHTDRLRLFSTEPSGRPIKVAATSAPVEQPASYAQKAASPPKPSNAPCCNICNKDHATVTCTSLAHLPSTERFQVLKNKGICHKCCNFHHPQVCQSIPTCSTCFKGHISLLHSDVPIRPNNRPFGRRQNGSGDNSNSSSGPTNSNNRMTNSNSSTAIPHNSNNANNQQQNGPVDNTSNNSNGSNPSASSNSNTEAQKTSANLPGNNPAPSI